VRQVLHPPISEITLAGFLSALGDPIRLAIVVVLSDGKEHVQADFDVPVAQSTLSHHMKILRENGVVLSRPEGTRCFISLRHELDDLYPGLLASVLRFTERGRS
jgi:DNA-binding transcriptional ArsR family regulator